MGPLNGHSALVHGVAFHPRDPEILVSCSEDQAIKVWDIISGSCISTLELNAGEFGVWCVTFNGTGDTMVAGCYNGNIFVIDTASNQVTQQLFDCEEAVWDVNFSPDGQHIAAACNDGSDGGVYIFSLNQESQNFEIRSELHYPKASAHGMLHSDSRAASHGLIGHSGVDCAVIRVAFSADGQWLISGCQDGMVRRGAHPGAPVVSVV